MLTEEDAIHLLCTCRQTPLRRGCRSRSTCPIARPPRRPHLALQRTTAGSQHPLSSRVGAPSGRSATREHSQPWGIPGIVLRCRAPANSTALLTCIPSHPRRPPCSADRLGSCAAGRPANHCNQSNSLNRARVQTGIRAARRQPSAARPVPHSTRQRRTLPSCRHGGSGLEKAGACHPPTSLLSFIRLLGAVRRGLKARSAVGADSRGLVASAQLGGPAHRNQVRPQTRWCTRSWLATPPGFAVPAWRRKTACPLL